VVTLSSEWRTSHWCFRERHHASMIEFENSSSVPLTTAATSVATPEQAVRSAKPPVQTREYTQLVAESTDLEHQVPTRRPRVSDRSDHVTHHASHGQLPCRRQWCSPGRDIGEAVVTQSRRGPAATFSASRQFTQQRFGCLQVRRLEAFGEPIVDGPEQLVGGLSLTRRG